MNGAKIVLECLAREKVECIFGYPGGVSLPVYDALYDYPIRHVLVRHEQNACFAAEGYARSTGRPGVCCATSGPGATNLVTGLVDAMMDSIPVVAITGQVSTKLIGTDAFQEADTFGITRSCFKHNFFVKSLADLPQAIHEAFHIASTGRPGPVLVDIPKDVLQAQGEYSPVSAVHLPGYKLYAEGARRPDPARGADDLGSGAALYIRRRRDRRRGGIGGTAGAGRTGRRARSMHADGPGSAPGLASEFRQHAGNAWQLRGQYGHEPGRSADRSRRSL